MRAETSTPTHRSQQHSASRRSHRTLSPATSTLEECIPRPSRSIALQLSTHDMNALTRSGIVEASLTGEDNPYLLPFPMELSGFDPVSPLCNYPPGAACGVPASCESPYYSSESCYSTGSETPLPAVPAQPFIPFGDVASSQPSSAGSYIPTRSMFNPEQFLIPQVFKTWNEHFYRLPSSPGIHDTYPSSFIPAVGSPPPSTGFIALSLTLK